MCKCKSGKGKVQDHKIVTLKVTPFMFKSMYIPEGTRHVLQRLSDMQAVIQYVGMCRRSCACTNKLVFVLQQVRTGDLGGYATSDEFTRAVIANLGN